MENINTLSLDLETYSDVDLSKCGVYKYAESPSFEILLFGVSVNAGEVRVYDIAEGEKVPVEILQALTNKGVKKWAFNASFERVCLSVWLRRNYPEYFKSYGSAEDSLSSYLDPESWHCSMVWSAYMGLPLSLAGVGTVLGLEEQKLKEGKDLIKYFCVPCKPTESNGGRTRNLPEHDAEKWGLFKEYNKRDVEVEMSIKDKLKKYPVPDFVWDEYYLDQKINDRGIALDMDLVRSAIAIDEKSRELLTEKMQELTNLDNPNSVLQMKDWLKDNGIEMESLGKKEVAEVLKTAPEPLRSVLLLRQQLSKSSVKKYQAMENAACSDGRARGMFVFYGANRSGRYSSRLIQVQNLARNHMEDLDEARELVKSANFEALSLLYDDIPDTLSQLVRTAFIPRRGYKFIVSDFSAIEARVLAWLAGEQWVLDVFSSGGDIYCETASRMFGVPVEKHGENSSLRQKGKQATLSCIAEGQLVLTDQGLIPIEKVSLSDKVWDGVEWVAHEGVIYKGERDVITHDGLSATPDHLVYVDGKTEPVRFEKLPGVSSQKASSRVGKAKVYDILNAGPRHRYMVSGHLVHNCGYGGGVGALKAMGAIEAGMKEEELAPLVEAWRASNPNIVKLWWDVDKEVKKALKEKTTTYSHGLEFKCQSGMLFIKLPSGRSLSYVKPRIGENKFGGESVTYEGIGTAKKWERIESYGPKFVENCIAEGTLVITDSGLVPIENVRNSMRIWDGEGYCSHGGLVSRGEQDVIKVNDIYMTPGHKILTDKGWKKSSESHGLKWEQSLLPEGFSSHAEESPLSISISSPGGRKPVYDILNCGPKHRFAVWNGSRALIVSNCVQAISRDILMYAMKTLSQTFICAHVHDELIIECPEDISVESICSLMGRTPTWMKGLSLLADGYECKFYKKS